MRAGHDAYWDQPILFPADAADAAIDTGAVLSIDVLRSPAAGGSGGGRLVGTAWGPLDALLRDSAVAAASGPEDAAVELLVATRRGGVEEAVVGGEGGDEETTVVLSVTFGPVGGHAADAVVKAVLFGGDAM